MAQYKNGKVNRDKVVGRQKQTGEKQLRSKFSIFYSHCDNNVH
jgi:hypothetical protein